MNKVMFLAATSVMVFSTSAFALDGNAGNGQGGCGVGQTTNGCGDDDTVVYVPGPQGPQGLPGTNGTNGLNGKDGKDGINGTNGKDGLNGTNGLDGKDGKDGINGTNGKDGTNGTNGLDGKDGLNGKDGKDGINGTNGKDGLNGTNGLDGTNGKDGAIGLTGAAGKDGINGTNGKDGINGTNGLSAYEIAKSNGFVGTQAEWLNSLKANDRAYTNEKIANVRFDLREMRKDMNGAIAGALAVSGIPQVIEQDGGIVGGAIGHYNGETAFAIGISKSKDNAVIKVGASVNTRGSAGGYVGVGFGF